MSVEEKYKKIKEYEDFIQHTLKSDLKEIEIILDAIVNSYKQWERLQQTIKIINLRDEDDSEVKIELPIGESISIKCNIFKNDEVYVNIGLGCYLPMNYVEADKYAEIRMRLLKREMEHYKKLAIPVKVNVKLALLAINELMDLPLR